MSSEPSVTSVLARVSQTFRFYVSSKLKNGREKTVTFMIQSEEAVLYSARSWNTTPYGVYRMGECHGCCPQCLLGLKIQLGRHCPVVIGMYRGTESFNLRNGKVINVFYSLTSVASEVHDWKCIVLWYHFMKRLAKTGEIKQSRIMGAESTEAWVVSSLPMVYMPDYVLLTPSAV